MGASPGSGDLGWRAQYGLRPQAIQQEPLQLEYLSESQPQPMGIESELCVFPPS